MLQRMELSGRKVDPQQYRSVVARLEAELSATQGDPALEPLLQSVPALSELYENMQYAHAGLCRSPLDAGLEAELRARRAIEAARAAAARR
ncbi:hypothetical protein WG922_12340 [Ramlibacter sp. AN1015]|uniref:hypothetical protein n=1 Tax=Ramlibacter sp. AN1015 TaxID=3133428 RepID=UPI0030C13881